MAIVKVLISQIGQCKDIIVQLGIQSTCLIYNLHVITWLDDPLIKLRVLHSGKE